MKKMIKTNFSLKVNSTSSWIVYLCKSYEEASAIHETCLTQKELLDGNWYFSVSTTKVLQDCRVPEFFHDRGYWVTVVEHNGGDWNKPSSYSLYIAD